MCVCCLNDLVPFWLVLSRHYVELPAISCRLLCARGSNTSSVFNANVIRFQTTSFLSIFAQTFLHDELRSFSLLT